MNRVCPVSVVRALLARADLVAANIPYVIEGPGGVPLFADMHSMRHTFIRMLDLAGTSLKEAMQLARHSDPKLTMVVYGQAGVEELVAKVDAVGAECFPSVSFSPATGGHFLGLDGSVVRPA